MSLWVCSGVLIDGLPRTRCGEGGVGVLTATFEFWAAVGLDLLGGGCGLDYFFGRLWLGVGSVVYL